MSRDILTATSMPTGDAVIASGSGSGVTADICDF